MELEGCGQLHFNTARVEGREGWPLARTSDSKRPPFLLAKGRGLKPVYLDLPMKWSQHFSLEKVKDPVNHCKATTVFIGVVLSPPFCWGGGRGGADYA